MSVITISCFIYYSGNQKEAASCQNKMVSTCCNCIALAETQTEVIKTLYVNSYTQNDLPRSERAAQNQSCMELHNAEVLLGVWMSWAQVGPAQ